MPRITQYVSPEAQRGVDPSQLATAAHRVGIAGSESANSIRQGFNAVGRSVENIGAEYGLREEAPRLVDEKSRVTAKLAQDTNDFFNSADPTDPELFQKYQEKVLQPALDGFGNDTISGPGGHLAQQMREDLENHFTNVGVESLRTVTKGAVNSSFVTMTNNYSNATYADPSLLGYAQNAFKNSVEVQIAAHHLSPEDAAEFRSKTLAEGQKQIAVAAARGMAERNPVAAQKALTSGAFNDYLSGDEVSRLNEYADAQSRASITAQKAQAEEVRRQSHEDFEAKSASLTASFMQPDGSMAVPPNAPQMIAQLALHPGASAGEVRSLADMTARVLKEQQEGKKAVTDPHTYDDFKSRLTLGADDPRALTDEQVISARANGQLSDKDYGFFKGAISTLAKDPGYRVAQQQFKSFMRGIRSSITNSNVLMGKNDPAGDQKYLQFEQQATTEFEQAYKTGKWHDLLARDNKTSLWHQAVPYMTGQKESLENLTNRAQGNIGLVPSVNAPKRNAGESAADYLKRTGGP